MKKSLTFVIVLCIALGTFVYFAVRNQANEESSSAISPWNEKTITRLSITHEQGQFELYLRQEPTRDWYLISPRNTLADYSLVNKFVQLLVEIGLTAKAAEAPHEHITEPWLMIALGDDNATTTLSFGQKAASGEDYYVSINDTLVYLVPEHLLYGLEPSELTLNKLRAKSIVHFYPWEVEGLTLEGLNEEPIVLSKIDEKSWQMDRPYQELADYTAVSDILWEYANLRAVDFFDDVQDLHAYQLDEPALIATFKLENGSTTTVLISPKSEKANGYYVKTQDSDTVYFIRKYSFLPLDVNPKGLIKTTLISLDTGFLDQLYSADGVLELSLIRTRDSSSCGNTSIPEASVTDLLSILQNLRIESTSLERLGKTKFKVHLDRVSNPVPL